MQYVPASRLDVVGGTYRAVVPICATQFVCAAVNLLILLRCLQSLSWRATPFPAYGTSASTESTTTLSQVHCTAQYQRATVIATATLTDASTYDVSTSASLTVASATTAAVAVRCFCLLTLPVVWWTVGRNVMCGGVRGRIG